MWYVIVMCMLVQPASTIWRQLPQLFYFVPPQWRKRRHKRSKMADKVSKKRAVASAAVILKLSKGDQEINVHKAMKQAGFLSPEARDQALRRQVYRQRDDLDDCLEDMILDNGRKQ